MKSMVQSDEGAIVYRYRMTLSYCGADFHGWQSQPSGMGIQDSVEKCLATMCRETMRLTSASRTDTGVHAEHQVVTFRSSQKFELHRLLKGLNALLPKSVRVIQIEFASPEFHPIQSSMGKIYRYRIWRAHGEHPFIMPYVWKYTNHIDVLKMASAAQYFVGEHDFTSFCAIDSSAKSKIRKIFEIQVKDQGPLVDLWFYGEGFLKQMVRNLVGAIVACGNGKMALEAIPELLSGKDRRLAPATAPASGLSLVRVCYDQKTTLQALLATASTGYNLPLDMFSQLN